MTREGSATLGLLPQPGDIVAGKYRILRIIGEGGMGVVFEAVHEGLNQLVALKVLRCDELDRVEEYFERFEREARAAAKLKGKNVARVSDVDTLESGTPFMVMELLQGTDLDAVIETRGRLPIGEAVDYLLQACSAVAEAHSRGIVHRDLKPHNLFLTHEDGQVVVKLLDFGISKVQDETDTSVTLTRVTLGTPLYMAPEQIRATRNADERSDIWSLGVILYQLLTGLTPFDGENSAAVIAAIAADDVPPPKSRWPQVPDSLDAVVMKALSKRPDARYQSVEEFAEALEPHCATSSWVPPPPISGVEVRALSMDAPTLSLEELEASSRLALEKVEIESAPASVGQPVGSTRKLVGLVIVVAAVAAVVFLAFRQMDAPSSEAASPAQPETVLNSGSPSLPQAAAALKQSPAPAVVGSGSPALAPGQIISAKPAAPRPPLDKSRTTTPRTNKPRPKASPTPAPKAAPAPKAPAPTATENPVHL